MPSAEQRIASIVRQVVAVAAVVMGALTSAVSGIHLPPAVSAVMVAAGGVVIALEHYLSDPSTGTTPTPPAPVAAPVATPVPPVAAPAPVPAAPAPPVAA
jgi:hypothetical protein